MQIAGLTSIAPLTTIVAPGSTATASKPAATPPSAPPAPSTTAASPATAAASTKAATGAAASAKSSSSRPASTQSSSDASQEDTLAAVYSASVGGKAYSGSVDESGGQYSASVPNLPGATASGSSIQAAESNLTLKIDMLV